MALGVTGIDANGRVTTGAAVSVSGGVLIPKESAGIGDLIYKNGTSNYVVIGRGTATGSTVTVGSTTYTLWGCIYGFVAGMAMVVAPDAAQVANVAWGSYPANAPYWAGGTPMMRNGKKHTYVQMNTAQNANYITKNDVSQPTDGLLTSAYQSTPLTESTFDSTANAETKKRFGSWKEYIRQTLRVNGAPGTPFGAPMAPSGGTAPSGVKVHEFGRWCGRNYFSSFATTTAGGHCYNYQGSLGNDEKGTWWLPSMFELAELMIDDHLTKVNSNSGRISVSAGLSRWSCVLISAGLAWFYYSSGMSGDLGLSDTSSYLVARPVTLLRLVS